MILLVVTCSTLVMVSCQSDEAELGSKSKIEMLKAKSKELAKKYGVDVTLNEDSIVKYADLMTVESMEADYKAFAEMKKGVQCNDTVLMRKKTLSKKKFFARRKVETETMTPDMLNAEGEINSSGTVFREICDGTKITYEANASWKSVDGTIKVNLHSVTLHCNSSLCNNDDGHQCTGCNQTCSFESWRDVSSGSVTTNGVYFTTTYVMRNVSLCAYSLGNVSVEVSCSGKHGSVKLHL